MHRLRYRVTLVPMLCVEMYPGGSVSVMKRQSRSPRMPRQSQIAKTIGRPTELGKVEGLSIWGIRLDDVVIPPTETDESTVTVDDVDLEVTLRSLLFRQVVGCDLRLVRPQVSLVQGADAQWIDLVLPEPPEEESWIGLEIQSLIVVEDASLIASTRIQDPAAPIARDPVAVKGVDIVANFCGAENQQVSFNVNGEVASVGGTVPLD